MPEELIKFFISNGPWAVFCLLLWYDRNEMIKYYKEREALTQTSTSALLEKTFEALTKTTEALSNFEVLTDKCRKGGQ